jgi:RsiW-degrading membrane proteinase PrsW (M82 family)
VNVSPGGSRAMTRVLAVVTAALAVAAVVVGVLAVSVAHGRAAITAMGVALLVSAAISGTLSVLFQSRHLMRVDDVRTEIP